MWYQQQLQAERADLNMLLLLLNVRSICNSLKYTIVTVTVGFRGITSLYFICMDGF